MLKKEDLLEDMKNAARNSLEKEERDGREAYHIVRRLSRLAGFSGKAEDFQKAIELLGKVEYNKGWKDEIISNLAVSYARIGNYIEASNWARQLYFTKEKDETRLAIIEIMVRKGEIKDALKLLDEFEKSYPFTKALLVIGKYTAEIKYFKRAYKQAVLTKDIDFDRIETIMDIIEALDGTTIKK